MDEYIPEIWFRKTFAGRFIPVHRNGFFLILVTFILVGISIYFGNLAYQLNYNLIFYFCIAFGVFCMFLSFAIAHRHS